MPSGIIHTIDTNIEERRTAYEKDVFCNGYDDADVHVPPLHVHVSCCF